MDHGRVVKKIFESKPEGRRIMERSRFRCLQDVEEGLLEISMKWW
jgi:hypothetical protein